MTVATVTNHRVKAARPKPAPAPRRPSPIQWAAKLPIRVVRSISFRTRRALSRENWGVIKRNYLFPVRNALLCNKPLRVRAGGQRYLLAPKGAVPLEMWAGRYFEKHELDFILDILEPGMTFVDVGANVGLFSIPAAMKVGSGRVFAFEPSPSTYGLLVTNAQLNNLTNLHAVRSALGDYVGKAVLNVNVSGKDGLNTIGKPTHPQCEVTRKETVPITTLDMFLRENGITHIKAMKIDVEGAEPLVLHGATGLLARLDAPLILFECGQLSAGFGYHPVESVWLLQEFGYSLLAINASDGTISKPFVKQSQMSDMMAIAVKPTHPSYPALMERAR